MSFFIFSFPFLKSHDLAERVTKNATFLKKVLCKRGETIAREENCTLI